MLIFLSNDVRFTAIMQKSEIAPAFKRNIGAFDAPVLPAN
jgi:hypothetical protein